MGHKSVGKGTIVGILYGQGVSSGVGKAWHVPLLLNEKNPVQGEGAWTHVQRSQEAKKGVHLWKSEEAKQKAKPCETWVEYWKGTFLDKAKLPIVKLLKFSYF